MKKRNSGGGLKSRRRRCWGEAHTSPSVYAQPGDWRRRCARSELFGRAQVGSAVAEEAGARDRSRENDANGNEDRACSRRIGNSDFQAAAFGILIAAAEGEATFGKIFADGDFFLKTTATNAGEDARFDARAIAARHNA